jgi:hypothetical protein
VVATGCVVVAAIDSRNRLAPRKKLLQNLLFILFVMLISLMEQKFFLE